MKNGIGALIGGVLLLSCASQKSVINRYPEKFEGLTQLVLASQTQTLSFTDTTVQKVMGFKIGSAQVSVKANVTFDFYLDFEKDGYSMSFNTTGDTLHFNAPFLRVKKPVINRSEVSYPEKHILINEQENAVKRLETLTDEFIDEGEALLSQEHVRNKCTEMLDAYLKDMCKKMGYTVTRVIIQFPTSDTPAEMPAGKK
ncbi:MAG: hypothetical protein JW795_13060 [Chitinivibrionales bacterium]|nr:hypothetical protein [Chitinivibrionales bacterium]